MSADDLLWRIDSLEARAGLAFGSFRASVPLTGSLPDLDLPGFFIAAPDFQPELLSSRTLGFSAARHGFQEGLFSGKVELGFQNQRSLIEFVRRCYVRGSSGDGTDGGAGRPLPPAPPPEDFTPEPPPTDEGEPQRSFTNVLSKDTTRFAELSKSLNLSTEGEVATKEFDWLSEQATQVSYSSHAIIPRRGAEEVFFQLILGTEQWRDTSDFLRWRQALTGLSYACYILHIDLDPDLMLERWEAVFRGNPRGRHRLQELVSLLDPYYYYWHRHFRRFEDEPFEVLGRLPLPLDLRRLVNPIAPAAASVMDFLSYFIGSPASILILPAPRQRVAIDLVLFAAGFLTHMDSGLPTSMSHLPAPSFPDLIPGLERERAIHRAAAWLRDQMPKQAFPEAVESMIGQAASITRLIIDNKRP